MLSLSDSYPSNSFKSAYTGNVASYSREELIKLRRMAIRRRVWLRALSQEERLLVNLAIEVIETRVKSKLLAQRLSEIVDKTSEALRRKFLGIFGWIIGRGIRELVNFARHIGDAINLAFTWGCNYALRWAKDLSFIRSIKQVFMV